MSWLDKIYEATSPIVAGDNDTQKKAKQAEQAAEQAEKSVLENINADIEKGMQSNPMEVAEQKRKAEEQELIDKTSAPDAPEEKVSDPVSKQEATKLNTQIAFGMKRVEKGIKGYESAMGDNFGLNPIGKVENAEQTISRNMDDMQDQKLYDEWFHPGKNGEQDKLYITADGQKKEIYPQMLDNAEIWRFPISREFHGREQMLSDEQKDRLIASRIRELEKGIDPQGGEKGMAPAVYSTPGAMAASHIDTEENRALKEKVQALKDYRVNTPYFINKMNEGRLAVVGAMQENDVAIKALMAKAGTRDAVTGKAYEGLTADEQKELEDRKKAAHQMKETLKVYDRPRKGYNDSLFADYGKAAKDWMTDVNNFTAGIPNIETAIDTRKMMKRAEKLYGTADFSKLPDEALEVVYNPGELSLIESLISKQMADAELSDYNTTGYQGGIGTLDMIQFCVEMYLFGGLSEAGIAKALSKGLSKEMVAEAGKLVASKEAKSLVDATVKYLAKEEGVKGFAKAAMVRVPATLAKTIGITAMSPTTWEQVATDMAQTDDSGRVVNAWNTLGKSFASKAVDTFTEQLGVVFDKGFAKIGDIALNKLFNADNILARAMASPAGQIMQDSAFSGFVGEGLEEVVGAAIMDVTGLDKGAWKEFWQPDNLAVLAATIAPATLFGMGVSTAQAASAKARYEKAKRALMEDDRVSQTWLEGADNAIAGTPLNDIFSTKNEMFKQMLADNPDVDLQQKIANYMQAAAVYDAYKKVDSKKTERELSAKRQEIEGKLGGETFTRTKEDGTEYVDRVYLKGGVEGFITSEDENGNFTIVLRDPKSGQRAKQIRSREDIMQYKDEKGNAVVDEQGNPRFAREEVDIDNFLRGEMVRQNTFEEQRRMQEEKGRKMRSLKATATPGAIVTHKPTDEDEGVDGTIQAVDADGVTIKYNEAVDINGKKNKIQKLSWADYARELHKDISVKTDEQKKESEARVLEMKRQQRRAINEKGMGGAFTFEGKDYILKQVVPAEDDATDTEKMSVLAVDMETGEDASLKVPTKTLDDAFKVQARDYGALTLEDFGGDENLMWNNAPESWAVMNDERQGDAGKSTIQKCQKAIDILNREIASRQSLINETTDASLVQRYKAEIKSKQERIDLLADTVINNYSQGIINEALGIVPEVKAEEEAKPQEEQKKPAEIPTDEKGKPLYHLAPVEDTLAKLNEKLSPEEAQAFAETQLKSALSDMEKLQKNAPKMGDDIDAYVKARDEYAAQLADAKARADYWNMIANPIGVIEDALTKRDQARTTPEALEAFTKTASDVAKSMGLPADPLVVTMQNYKALLRQNGFSGETIAEAQKAISDIMEGRKAGQDFQLNGLQADGKIVIFAEFNADEAQIRKTLTHESQHLHNKMDANKTLVKAIAEKMDEKALLESVRKLSGADTSTYMGRSAEYLADELSAFGLEDATAEGLNEERLRKAGVNDEIINILNDEYRAKQSSDYWTPAGSDTHDNVSDTANASVHGGDQAEGSPEVGEQGTGSLQGSEQEVRREVEDFISGDAFSVKKDGELLAYNDNGIPSFSVRTWEEGGREILVEYLKKQKLSKAEIANFMEAMDAMASQAREYAENHPESLFGKWSFADIVVDKNGCPVMHALKDNDEYSLNIDFSTVCKKRQVIDHVMNELIRRGEILGDNLSPADVARVNEIIQKHGMEIACEICFVDSRRYNAFTFAETFAEKYNNLVHSLAPKEEVAGFNYSNNTKFSNEGKVDLSQNEEVVTWEDIFGGTAKKPKNLDKYSLDLGGIVDLFTSDRTDSKGKPKLSVVEEAREAYKNKATKAGKGGTRVRKTFDECIASACSSAEEKMAYSLSKNPYMRKLVKEEDFVASEGWTNILQNNAELERLWNIQKGASGARPNEPSTQYKGEVIKKQGGTQNIWDIAGYRMQSFSDFIGRMYFDYLQAFADLAAKHLPGHAYTKEPSFVKLFGAMGIKINMSLVAAIDKSVPKEYAGMTKDSHGKYVYNWNVTIKDADGNIIRQGQTFPPEEAFRLQADKNYTKNAGTIAVGVSPGHIRTMLNDPAIRMVIPYHKSGLPHIVAVMYDLQEIYDYTDYQNDRKKGEDGKLKGLSKEEKPLIDPPYNFILHQLSIAENLDASYNAMRRLFGNPEAKNIVGSKNTPANTWKMQYDALYEEEVKAGNKADIKLGGKYGEEGFLPKVAADIFIEGCRSHGLTPRFDEFTDEYGYFKTLEDFSTYDNDGNYTPQTEIEFRLPENVGELIQETLEEDESISAREEANMTSMLDEIVSYLHDTELRQAQDEIAGRGKETKADERLLSRETIYNVGDYRNNALAEYKKEQQTIENPAFEETNLSFIALPEDKYSADPQSFLNSDPEYREEIKKDNEAYIEKKINELPKWSSEEIANLVDIIPIWIKSEERSRKVNVSKARKADYEIWYKFYIHKAMYAEALVDTYGKLHNICMAELNKRGVSIQRNPDIMEEIGATSRGTYAVKDLRAWFDKYNNDEHNKALFDRVIPTLEMVEKLGMTVKFGALKNHVVGNYSANKMELTLSSRYFKGIESTDKFAETILHESIHAVTTYALFIAEEAESSLRNYNPTVQENLRYIIDNTPKEVVDAASQLNDIFTTISGEESIQKLYGGKNAHEMVAELSNPAFREELKKLNLWEKVVNAIHDFINAAWTWLRKGEGQEINAYDAVRRNLEFLLDNYDPWAASMLTRVNENGMVYKAQNGYYSVPSFSFTRRSDSEREDLFKKAKEEFGTTEDFREAGYILPDGDMLDFSEKNDGGPAGHRSLDHRSIMRVIDGREYDSATAYMSDFMNEGAIRIMPESGALNIMRPLTDGQRMVVRRFIRRNNGEVILDVDDENGRTKAYKEYPAWTEADKILADAQSALDGYSIEDEEDEDYTSFRVVTDQALLDKLNSEPTINVYRAMQLIDGKLYPPMSAYVDGVLRPSSEFGVWEESEEHPEFADENGKVILEQGKNDKGKDMTTRGVNYNPYFHTRIHPLNDQFSGAQDRSNLVIVEVEVPESELKSGYKAEKAHNSVGQMPWHSGPLASILHQYKKPTDVVLTRWAKPVRFVEADELAEDIAELFKDTPLESYPLPSNVFSPDVRFALEDMGFKFEETDNKGRIIGNDGDITWSKQYKRDHAKKTVKELKKALSSEKAAKTRAINKANALQKQASKTYVPSVEMEDDINFRLTKNNRELAGKWLDKWLNASTEGMPNKEAAIRQMEPIKQQVIDWVEQSDDATYQLAYVKWFCAGAIRYGAEDDLKVRQAIDLARKHKVDPLRFDSPMAIINNWPSEIKEKPINPDEVATLHLAKSLENGIKIYDVDDTEESRQMMRKIINTHFGKDCSPWCLLQGDGEGNLTSASARYWEHYNAYPKQVAFKDGKLIAFSANDRKERVWWDRQDASHPYIPVIGKIPGDKLGRSATGECDPMTGALIKYDSIHKGEYNKGHFEIWYSDGVTKEYEWTKDESGKFIGDEFMWHPNGVLAEEQHFDEKGGRIGSYIKYYESGQRDEQRDYDEQGRQIRYSKWNRSGEMIRDHTSEFLPDGVKVDKAWTNDEWRKGTTTRISSVDEERTLEDRENGQGIRERSYNIERRRITTISLNARNWYRAFGVMEDSVGDFKILHVDNGFYLVDKYFIYKDRLVKHFHYETIKSPSEYGKDNSYELWDMAAFDEAFNARIKEGRTDKLSGQVTSRQGFQGKMDDLSELVPPTFDELVEQQGGLTLEDVPMFRISDDTKLQGMDLTAGDAIAQARSFAEDILADTGVSIKDIAVVGSRSNGSAIPTSDLDILLEYEGDAKEDAVFNWLNEEPLEIGGVPVGINPIRKEESGDIDGWIESHKDFRKRESETDLNPSEAQKKAGNYKMEHRRLDGYSISIENPKGSVRSGKDESGKEWSQEMHNDYGYIRGTEGVDGDHIDVFLSDTPEAGDVFVVDQVNPKNGEFDEHKVMYGFGSIEEAREAYLSNYEEGWQGLGAITPVSKEEFKKWVNSSHRKTKPFAEYVGVKTLGDTQISSVTAEQDAEYRKAYEEGDEEKAMQMVKAAFKAAFPNTKVVDENGEPLVLYHGGTFTTDGNFVPYNNTHFGTKKAALDRALQKADNYYYLIFTRPGADGLFRWDLDNFFDIYDENDSKEGVEMSRLIDQQPGYKTDDEAREAGRRALGKVIPEYKRLIEGIRNGSVPSGNEMGLAIVPVFLKVYNLERVDDMGNDWEQLNGAIDPHIDGVVYENKYEDKGSDSYIAFSPSQVKSADPFTFDSNGDLIPLSQRFNPENDDIRFRIANGNQEMFVSNAEASLDRIKMEKATPAQWKAMIQKEGGLKAGEDKWLGLSEWLDSSDKKTLTKDEVRNFISENAIQIEETRYAESPKIPAYFKKQVELCNELIKKYPDDWNRDPSYMRVMQLAYPALKDLMDKGIIVPDTRGKKIKLRVSEYYESEEGEVKSNTTRLAYTTGGLKKKREIALTVPTIELWRVQDRIHFGDAGEGRAIAWIRFGETTAAIPYTDTERQRFIDELGTLDEWKKIDGSRFVAKRDLYIPKNQVHFANAIVDYGDNGWAVMLGSKVISMHPTKEDAFEAYKKAYDEWRQPKTKMSKLLVIDEIQSKRHQDGREKGYTSTEDIERMKELNEEIELASHRTHLAAEEWGTYKQHLQFLHGVKDYKSKSTSEELAELDRLAEERNHQELALNELVNERSSLRHKIPVAPFEKNWHELAFKRMLRLAAEEGYDKLAWTSGAMQAERYDLSKVVNSIKRDEDEGENQKYFLNIENGGNIGLVVDKDGNVISSNLPEYEGHQLKDIVGKSVAEKMMSLKEQEKLEGDNLRIGGEGMNGFYDKMLPAFVDKYCKKWGVKTVDTALPELDEANNWHTIDITPEMKESVMEGQVMFAKKRKHYSTPIRIEDKEEYGAFIHAATMKNAQYYNDVPFENFVFTAKNCYLYNTVGEDIYPVQSWEIEANREKIKELTNEIESNYDSKRDKASLDRVLVNILGKEGYVPTDTFDDWRIEESNASLNALYERQKSLRARNNTNGNSASISNSLNEDTNRYRGREDFVDIDASEAKVKEGKIKINGLLRFKLTSAFTGIKDPNHVLNWVKVGCMTNCTKHIDASFDRSLGGFGEVYTPAKYEVNEEGKEVLIPDGEYITKDEDGQLWLDLGKVKEDLRKVLDKAVDYHNDIRGSLLYRDGEYLTAEERDAEYMDAVNSGDMERAAELVREAFKAAFPDTKVVDEDGKPKIMYHGTGRSFNVFKNNDTASELGPGFYFTNDRKLAEWYTSKENQDNIGKIEARANELFFEAGHNEEDLYDNEYVSEWNKCYEQAEIELFGAPQVKAVFLNVENPRYVARDNKLETSKDDYDGVIDETFDVRHQALQKHTDGPTMQIMVYDSNQIKSADPITYDDEGNIIPLSQRFNGESDDIRFSIREKEAPVKTGTGYKVFVLKNGRLYPPMVNNAGGVDTPVSLWLDAEAAPIAGQSRTGRNKVKSGGGTLAYRPGWHLGRIPYALQFNRGEKVDNPLGIRSIKGDLIKVGKYFPKNFVWAEVEYAADKNYQKEAMSYGYNENGKFQHSLAGLPAIPVDGFYEYRTNANPATDPWIITGAMRVKKILTPSEVDELVREAGREPQLREPGAFSDAQIEALNESLSAREEDSEDAKAETAQALGEALGVKVNIIYDRDSIEDRNRKRQRRKRNSKGWYDTVTQEIVVVLQNNVNNADVEATILHEIVGHKGMRELVGDENYNDFLEKVYRAADPELRKKITELAKKHDWDFNLATEEYIASLAENGFNDRLERNLFEKIRDLFVDMLRRAKIALGYNINDNDLRYMLWRAYKGRIKSALDLAEDINTQNNMRVGDYAAPENYMRYRDEMPDVKRDRNIRDKKTLSAFHREVSEKGLRGMLGARDYDNIRRQSVR